MREVFMLTRRHFMIGAASVTAAAGAFPRPALAQAKPRVVVVGGGAGGASVVRRLAASANDGLDITLVEPQEIYTTCFYSNLYLGGFQPLEVLQYRYDAIAALPGVTVARDLAKTVNREPWSRSTASKRSAEATTAKSWTRCW
jgi:hypothetical protein